MSTHKSKSCLSDNHEECDRLVWRPPLADPESDYCTCNCGCDGIGQEWQ